MQTEVSAPQLLISLSYQSVNSALRGQAAGWKPGFIFAQKLNLFVFIPVFYWSCMLPPVRMIEQIIQSHLRCGSHQKNRNCTYVFHHHIRSVPQRSLWLSISPRRAKNNLCGLRASARNNQHACEHLSSNKSADSSHSLPPIDRLLEIILKPLFACARFERNKQPLPFFGDHPPLILFADKD